MACYNSSSHNHNYHNININHHHNNNSTRGNDTRCVDKYLHEFWGKKGPVSSAGFETINVSTALIQVCEVILVWSQSLYYKDDQCTRTYYEVPNNPQIYSIKSSHKCKKIQFKTRSLLWNTSLF